MKTAEEIAEAKRIASAVQDAQKLRLSLTEVESGEKLIQEDLTRALRAYPGPKAPTQGPRALHGV